jgi:hypothetical protein
MPPAPSVARRLPPLGCALLAAAALTLSACGGEGADAESTGARAAKAGAKAAAKANRAARPCPPAVTAFVGSLDRLRERLAVGLSYEQYAAEMKALRVSYDAIPADRLTIGCLAGSAGPGEGAYNRYVDAANAWGECLADASCTTATIEPVLQRKWRLASRRLAAAQ